MFNQMNQNAQQMAKPEEKDSLGGNVKETGTYPATIDLAYIKKAASGALMFNITFKLEDNSTFNMQECIQSGDAKGNKPYYVKDGKQIALPGYTTISTITELLLNKPLDQFTDADLETKTLRLYDSAQSKEVPQDVPFISALKGKKALLGLLAVQSNKQTKQGNTYVDTNEKRLSNELSKLFDENGLTLTERKANIDSPEFLNKWKEKYGNEQVDRFKEVKKTAMQGNTSSAQGSSMFAKTSDNSDKQESAGSGLFPSN